MPFNINEIRASLSKVGYQKTSHYTTNVILPASLGGKSIMSETPLRINSINLPGVNLAVDDLKHKGYGLSEKRPVQASFDDIALTMIADSKGEVAEAMHSWFQLILPTDEEETGTWNSEYFEYPVNYYGGLEITVYDITGTAHTKYTFTNPFPTNLGSVQMAWENTDSLMLIPVSFAYRSYRRNSTNSGYTTK